MELPVESYRCRHREVDVVSAWPAGSGQWRCWVALSLSWRWRCRDGDVEACSVFTSGPEHGPFPPLGHEGPARLVLSASMGEGLLWSHAQGSAAGPVSIWRPVRASVKLTRCANAGVIRFPGARGLTLARPFLSVVCFRPHRGTAEPHGAIDARPVTLAQGNALETAHPMHG